jgi:hypothetical protein
MDQRIRRKKSEVAERDLELVAEKLIDLAGSKREAHRAIDRAEAKGKPRRRRGPQHLQADAQLIWLAIYLETEWRLRSAVAVPSRRELITKLVDLSWPLTPPDRPNQLSLARDLMACSSLGGASEKRVVIDRLLARQSLWTALGDRAAADLQQQKTRARPHRSHQEVFIEVVVEERPVRIYTPPLGLFEAMHLQKPELRILPATPEPQSAGKSDLH